MSFVFLLTVAVPTELDNLPFKSGSSFSAPILEGMRWRFVCYSQPVKLAKYRAGGLR